MSMKVLSVKQPWASLIVSGVKDIENRTWKTSYRGIILIHSSAKPVNNFLDTYQFLTEDQFKMAFENNFKLGHLSAILGKVDIVDCVINHQSIWAEKTEMPAGTYMGEKLIWNLVLENPILFDEPIINVKGKLNLWNYE